MCRTVSIGCLVILAAGILVLVGLGFVVTRHARDIAPPMPDEPITIDGSCPRDDVIAWAEGNHARFNAMFGAMEDMGPEQPSTDMDRDEALDRINSIDVEAMRSALAAYGAATVPPCIEDIRAAEIEFADMVIRSVDWVQAGTNITALRSAGSMLAMARGTAGRIERLGDAYDRLSEQIDTDLDAILWSDDNEE